MNSCVLMAEIIQAPELRYTQDGNLAIAEMVVQFPPLRAEDPMQTLKVTGWGNLAQQIQDQFHQGDQVVVEGRLGMRTIERPEGFKEKVAELRASRVHPLAMATGGMPTPTAAVSAPVPAAPPVTPPPAAPAPATTPAAGPIDTGSSPVEPNYDDIPF